MSSQIDRFTASVAEHRGLMLSVDPVERYRALHDWSTEHLPQFWRELWDFFELYPEDPLGPGDGAVLADRTMPGAQWFPGRRLNYVDEIARQSRLAPDREAVVQIDEDGTRTALTWSELVAQVGSLAAELTRRGVREGDAVAAYLPDVAAAVVGFLASAAIGAVWSGCGQDYSPAGAAARLAQLRPKLLITGPGYHWGGKWIDKRADAQALAALLPELGSTLWIDSDEYREATGGAAPLRPLPVPFDHPLWTLFSSGTTGTPKGIVHGHGGVLLEHLKCHGLHSGIDPGEVFFWQTALSWMMWNYRVGALLRGATMLCYSGNPMTPGPDRLWQIVADEKVNYFGTSPGHLGATRKAGCRPGHEHDLRALRILGSSGAPLPGETFTWAMNAIGTTREGGDLEISSITGGTDVVSAFAGGSVGIAAVPGEISVPYLGCDLHSWGPDGSPLIGAVGELVITAPMPSMPVHFVDDPDGAKYQAAYFDHAWTGTEAATAGVWQYGVWRHGDWVTVTERGSLIVHGRSDATLNRNGIRMGSADIYEVVEALPEVREAFVLGVDRGPDDYWMPLFITVVDGVDGSDGSEFGALTERIVAAIRTRLSPRHVPDEVILAPGIPHTRTGKKLEVPVTAIFAGRPTSVDERSVDDPEVLRWFREYPIR